jgi:hypothetical protein
MKNLGRFGLAGALLLTLVAFERQSGVKAAGGPLETANDSFRVLAPIESGNLLLFPVVRANGKSPGATPFLTLDEGIKSGQVEDWSGPEAASRFTRAIAIAETR